MARCQFGLQSWCCSLISPPGEFHDALLKVCTDWDEGGAQLDPQHASDCKNNNNNNNKRWPGYSVPWGYIVFGIY